MSRFTTAERVEIMAEAHRNLAQPVPGSTSSRYTSAERARIMAEARQNVAHLKPKSSSTKRDIVYKTAVQPPPAAGAVAGSEQAWWQWVEEHVEARFATLSDAVGEVIGTLVKEARDETEQCVRELELLKREFGVLRDEVGVEHRLRDLRTEVIKAQRQVPKVPAIEARLRAEALIAGTKTDQELTELRRDLQETRSLLKGLQAEHAKLPQTLEHVLELVQASCVEYEERYEEHSRRWVYSPTTMSPEPAAGLRAFAEKVLGTDGVIIEH